MDMNTIVDLEMAVRKEITEMTVTRAQLLKVRRVKLKSLKSQAPRPRCNKLMRDVAARTSDESLLKTRSVPRSSFKKMQTAETEGLEEGTTEPDDVEQEMRAPSPTEDEDDKPLLLTSPAPLPLGRRTSRKAQLSAELRLEDESIEFEVEPPFNSSRNGLPVLKPIPHSTGSKGEYPSIGAGNKVIKLAKASSMGDSPDTRGESPSSVSALGVCENKAKSEDVVMADLITYPGSDAPPPVILPYSDCSDLTVSGKGERRIKKIDSEFVDPDDSSHQMQVLDGKPEASETADADSATVGTTTNGIIAEDDVSSDKRKRNVDAETETKDEPEEEVAEKSAKKGRGNKQGGKSQTLKEVSKSRKPAAEGTRTNPRRGCKVPVEYSDAIGKVVAEVEEIRDEPLPVSKKGHLKESKSLDNNPEISTRREPSPAKPSTLKPTIATSCDFVIAEGDSSASSSYSSEIRTKKTRKRSSGFLGRSNRKRKAGWSLNVPAEPDEIPTALGNLTLPEPKPHEELVIKFPMLKDDNMKFTNTDDSEEYCAICRDGGEDIMVCCDNCPKVFHLKCHMPAVDDVPPDDWQCNWCKLKDDACKAPPPNPNMPELEEFLKKNNKGIMLKPTIFYTACKFLCEVFKLDECLSMRVALESISKCVKIDASLNLHRIRQRLTSGSPKPFNDAKQLIITLRKMINLINSHAPVIAEEYAWIRRFQEKFDNLVSDYFPEHADLTHDSVQTF